MVEIAMFNVQRAITPKVDKPELQFMCSAHCTIVFYICVKFGENISDGIRVMERTRIVEALTTGRTDAMLIAISPEPVGRGIKKQLKDGIDQSKQNYLRIKKKLLSNDKSPANHQGPVIQRYIYVSLTSSLMTNSLTVVAKVFSNTLIFLLEKM